MILAEDYPALSQLLAAYFHEDWKMDARNYGQLVQEFVASEPASLVGQVSVELKELHDATPTRRHFLTCGEPSSVCRLQARRT